MDVKDTDSASAGTPAVRVCVHVGKDVGNPQPCVEMEPDDAMPNDETVNRYIRTAFNRAPGFAALTTNQIIKGMQAYRPGSKLFSQPRCQYKKIVNRQLYAMEKKGTLVRTVVSPPTWKRIGKGSKTVENDKEEKDEMFIFIDASGYKDEEVDRFVTTCIREGLRQPVAIYPQKVDSNITTSAVFSTDGEGRSKIGPGPAKLTQTKKHDYKTFFVGYVCAEIALSLHRRLASDFQPDSITVMTVFRGLEDSSILESVFRNMKFVIKTHFIHETSLDEALLCIE